MTIVAEPTTTAPAEPTPRSAPARATIPPAAAIEDRAPTRPVPLVIGWLIITIVGIAVVLLAVGPISEERDQRALLTDYRDQIESASNQAFGLGGIEVSTKAPALGAAVAIIDIEGIGLSRVVVEGTEPQQTRQGPGHVVGTGGPGQPGNSVIVGRRALFGGAFADLDQLEAGDRILVTTAQGRTVYEVDHVATHAVEAGTGTESADAGATSEEAAPTTTAPSATDVDDPAADDAEAPSTEQPAALPDGPLTVDELYGPSPDDRLTLVTTASGAPGAADEAVVVVARMEGQAFAPTPQGGRTPGNDGRSGETGNWSALILALLAYVVAVLGTIWLHRNVPWRSAYLLTAPVLVALTIVLAEQLVSVLPAWA